VLASIMGVVLFGEHLNASGALAWTVAVASIVAMLVGTAWLARSPLVTEEVEATPAIQV